MSEQNGVGAGRIASQRLAQALRSAVATAFLGQPVVQRSTDDSLPLLDWGRRHLPEHFDKPPSPLHQWLGDQLDEVRARRGMKINVVGPRGAAKSTVATLAGVLRSALEGDERYLWIVSDTKAQAHAHLENVKTELVENRSLANAYPRSCGRGPRWRAGGIELRNGVVIEAYGTGQRIRGRRRRASRPTLIVCDDLQNDRHIASAQQREMSNEWFHGTLMKAGTAETNVINVATALHRDALAVRLASSAGWVSQTFRSIIDWPVDDGLWRQWEAVYCDADHEDAEQRAERFYQANRVTMDAGARVLWPEAESLYTLMKMRIEGGASAFEREKQSSPIDPARCEWPESYFEESCWFDDWPKRLTLCTIALDPSKGSDARTGDYSAYIVLGVAPNGVLHIQADLARRPTSQMVEDGVRLCERFRPHAFGVEANQWQQLLAGEFHAEFHRRGVVGVSPGEIHNHTSKVVRIRRLGPYLSQRRLRFKRRCRSTELLVNQLKDFPIGAHDDGPDALEMAIRLAEELWRTQEAPTE